MRKSTIFLSAAAVLVMGAGIVLGRLSTRLQAPPPQHAEHGRGWFQDQLSLSPDQRKSMDSIWADVRQQVDKLNEQRRGIDKDRDLAIRALLSPEQLTAYDKLFADARARHQELDKQRDAIFQTANQKSRALLSPEQQVKWDAMQKDMHDHHGPGGPGGHMHNDPSTQSHGAGTQP
jgi:Spy/CpxP family protein refolding chaperone